MEGLERRGVAWRQRKTVKGEDRREFGRFKRNTDGLGGIVAGRRGVEDIEKSLEYKRTDWRGLEGLGINEMDWRGLERIDGLQRIGASII